MTPFVLERIPDKVAFGALRGFHGGGGVFMGQYTNGWRRSSPLVGHLFSALQSPPFVLPSLGCSWVHWEGATSHTGLRNAEELPRLSESLAPGVPFAAESDMKRRSLPDRRCKRACGWGSGPPFGGPEGDQKEAKPLLGVGSF